MVRPLSPQTLAEPDRRLVAAWAADCAERVLALFEAEAPDDDRPRDAIARARAYARGELGTAGEIRRRLVAGRAAHSATSRAAAAYAAVAIALAHPDRSDARRVEVRWQIDRLTPAAADALRRLPRLGDDASGPLGTGLLASGLLGQTIRDIQAKLMSGRS